MSAVETTGLVPGPTRSYLAGAAGQKRGIFVIQGADDNHVTAAAAANADCLGVQLDDSINAGDPISVVRYGEAVCQIGAAVGAGTYCNVDSSGRLVPSTEAGDFVVAKVVSSGLNPGDFVVALITLFIR